MTTAQYLLQRKIEKIGVMCSGKTYAAYRVSENWAAPSYVNAPDAISLDWSGALRRKIKDKRLSFAETIGEFREAVSYVSDGANLLKRAWRTAQWLWRQRRHRKNIIKRLLKTGILGEKASGVTRWQFYDIVAADLALKFGIVPIMELVSEALERFGSGLTKAFRAQVTLTGESRATTPGVYSGFSEVRMRESKRAIAWIWLTNDFTDYTAGNILESLWAGARLTFMVDWFINVGSYLSALDAMSGVAEVRGTVVTRRTIWVDDRRIANSGWSLVSPGKLRTVSTWRDQITSVPMPLLPKFELPTDVLGKLMSSMEVLWSIRRSHSASA